MELTHLIGQVLDEKYLIERELGRGGMGAVYLAMHMGTDRPVALKVIAPEFMQHAEFVERFRREARAAGRLRHPNVVDVTDFGFARVGGERVAYLVMEYLDGCALGEVLAEESRLPLEWVVDILEQTCSALDEAHKQGIIHRDLKPDNIWLEPNHRGGYTVKVLDFGIAKLADSSETAPTEVTKATASSSATAVTLANESPTLLTPARAVDEKALSAAADLSSASRTVRESASAPEFTESETIIHPSAAAGVAPSEAPTQIQSATEADRTRLLGQHRTTGEQQRELSTATTDGLTRIGATLGTPFYMSPEQWRGETLDTRADIYSLGVIAYQMLSGRLPFKGDFPTVKRQHQEEPPPPLQEKHVPKKVTQAVMSALAKSPAQRPAHAGAFASALRANSEGAAILLRRAIALYSEHLPVFLRLMLLAYTPLFVITVLQVSFNIAAERGLVSKVVAVCVSVSLSLISMLCAFLTASVVIGITTRLVTQLLAAPLRPIQLRTAFAALRKRLKPFFGTTLMVSLLMTIGMILLVIPGLYMMVNYSLVTPVVMMEDIKGRAALRRSKMLVKRSRRTVILIVFVQFFIPMMSALLLSFLVISFIKVFNLHGSHANLFGNPYQIISFPINALILSFSAVITALLYLKTRQAGGETLTEALGKFEDEELPRRNWQLRMRERLHITTRQTRHTT